MDTYDQLENFIAKKKMETSKKPKQPQITKKEKTIMPGLMGAVEKLKSKKLVDEIKEDEEFEHTLEDENIKPKQPKDTEFDLMNIPKTKPKKEIKTNKKPEIKQEIEEELEETDENDIDQEMEEPEEDGDEETEIEDTEEEQDEIEDDEIEDDTPKKFVKQNRPKPTKKIFKKPQVKRKPVIKEQEYEDEDLFEEDYSVISKLKTDNKKLKIKLLELSKKLEELQISKENMKASFIERENYYKNLLNEKNNRTKPQATQPIENKRTSKMKSIIMNLVGLFIALFGFWISTEPKSMEFLLYPLQIGMLLMAIGISLFMSDKF
ncbi:MAG: hypothetical protein AMQ22_00577 [Candidatus Methanofastidiosum methylothiophilum]|uniref:Uncharacterized protein n=1 Tax=Candidatus Methanofastidiosum methylothiophilum TaxID=1705564 RepID=A0A150J6E1_9EURY|nr:MAG: hypothetical protein AMQ22_00577 [Candidatus Methanofastidiosum methylthiophilus]